VLVAEDAQQDRKLCDLRRYEVSAPAEGPHFLRRGRGRLVADPRYQLQTTVDHLPSWRRADRKPSPRPVSRRKRPIREAGGVARDPSTISLARQPESVPVRTGF
jgi:hypothetical protein